VSDDASFADLMGRLRSGGDDAAGEQSVRFARRQVGLARSHPAGAGVKIKAPDITSSALASGTGMRKRTVS
jgi:hypothetical protein